MRTFPILQTDRLLLREFRPSDAQAVYDIFSQDAVTRYHNLSTMTSIEQAGRLVTARAGLFVKGWGIRWAITLDGSEDVIGSCGFYRLDKSSRSAEIGYDLHPAYWRRGLMTEALTAILDHGYAASLSFELNRIEALTYLEHDASMRLLLRLGFQEEGIRRDYGYWKDAFHSLRAFSLLRRDWAQRRA